MPTQRLTAVILVNESAPHKVPARFNRPGSKENDDGHRI
jgi:hypothetical protein